MEKSINALKSTTLSLSQLTYAIASLAVQARINIFLHLHDTIDPQYLHIHISFDF